MNPKLLSLIQDDPRYMYEAYEFVCDTVSYTQEKLGRVPKEHQPEPADKNHVCGEELLRGACELAIQQFGMMAPVVFKQWGVHTTDDFGEMVFNLIKIEQLSKSDRDDRRDFHNVFDLQAALTDGFELTTAAYPARKIER